MNRDAQPRRKSLLVFGAPAVGQAEIDEVVDSMKSGWLGTGHKVKRFEEAFSVYKETPFCAAVNSCTAALHLSLLALDLKPGDEVITTPMTFCASVNAILHAGATPVLADVDPVTMNIAPECVQEKLTDKTRAVLPVHFGGRAVDMNSISKICQDNNLGLVEDCAHAIETTCDGQQAGTIGDFGCFSFYATKNVTTSEGGIVVCKREEDLDRIKRMALHGLSHDAWRRFLDKGHEHYLVTDLGFKYNMTDLQAAIGIHQLKRIEQNSERRQAVWNRYQEAFADLPFTRPAQPSTDDRHAYHLYTILVDAETTGISRDEFLVAMRNENIGTGVHYLSIASHPYYQDRFGWNPDDWPNANRIGNQTVSLPLSPALTDEDVDDVIAAVFRVVQ